MKKYCGIIIALVAISLFSAPMLHAQRFGRVERVDAELTPAQGHLVGLRIDPNGSLIRVLPNRGGRDQINSSFSFVSATCTNCSTGCPPTSRTVEVVLQANGNVAGEYGVAALTSANYTVTNVAYSTQAALTAGQQVTLTITGDVISCTTWFNVYFSMCDNEPASWEQSCPITIDLPGGETMNLVYIPAGTFQMGSPVSEWGRYDWEDLHEVTLTQGYYMGKTEVTQGQWEAVMGTNPAHDYGVGPDYPVYYVSWDDISGAGGFLEQLNTHLTDTGQPGAGLMRLPTEAEWERAARAETQTEFSFDTSGNPAWDTACGSFPEAEGYMWWCGNITPSGSKEVGTKSANGFGLYDMHGNLYELVEDWWQQYLGYDGVTDPTGPSTGSYRVVRGGDWGYYAQYCSSASRSYGTPSYRYNLVGFRLARSE